MDGVQSASAGGGIIELGSTSLKFTPTGAETGGKEAANNGSAIGECDKQHEGKLPGNAQGGGLPGGEQKGGSGKSGDVLELIQGMLSQIMQALQQHIGGAQDNPGGSAQSNGGSAQSNGGGAQLNTLGSGATS